MILKEYIKKDKKKEIEELSQKSSLLIGKGAVYPNDIGYLIFELSYIYNRPDLAPLTYDYVIQPKLFYEYCYKYKYFDTIEKKYIYISKIAKSTLHFHSLKVTVLHLKDLLHRKEKTMFH